MSTQAEFERELDKEEPEKVYYFYRVPFMVESLSSETEQMAAEQYRITDAIPEEDGNCMMMFSLAGDSFLGNAVRTAMRTWVRLMKVGIERGEKISSFSEDMVRRTEEVLDREDRKSYENSKTG